MAKALLLHFLGGGGGDFSGGMLSRTVFSIASLASFPVRGVLRPPAARRLANSSTGRAKMASRMWGWASHQSAIALEISSTSFGSVTTNWAKSARSSAVNNSGCVWKM